MKTEILARKVFSGVTANSGPIELPIFAVQEEGLYRISASIIAAEARGNVLTVDMTWTDVYDERNDDIISINETDLVTQNSRVFYCRPDTLIILNTTEDIEGTIGYYLAITLEKL